MVDSHHNNFNKKGVGDGDGDDNDDDNDDDENDDDHKDDANDKSRWCRVVVVGLVGGESSRRAAANRRTPLKTSVTKMIIITNTSL